MLCLTETWIQEEQNDLIHIDYYDFVAFYCQRELRGGGVAILLSTGHKYTERTDITEFTIDYIAECCAIEIESKDIIVAVYRNDRELEVFYC